MRITVPLLAVVRASVGTAAGQLLAIAVIIGPLIGLGALIAFIDHHTSPLVQNTLITSVILAELTYLAAGMRRVWRLAGQLHAHATTLGCDDFVAWQHTHDLRPVNLNRRPLDQMQIANRLRLASRLDHYLREVTHSRLWERALRLLPRGLVLYVVANATMTKLFDLPRVVYVVRTRNSDPAAWQDHVLGKVNAIYGV